jgi:hypothetical protein
MIRSVGEFSNERNVAAVNRDDHHLGREATPSQRIQDRYLVLAVNSLYSVTVCCYHSYWKKKEEKRGRFKRFHM